MAKRFALGVDITNIRIVDIHKVIQTVGNSANVTELWLLTSNPSKTIFPVPKTIPMTRSGNIHMYPSIHTTILELSDDGSSELEIITSICAVSSTCHDHYTNVETTLPFEVMKDSYLLGGYVNSRTSQTGITINPAFCQVEHRSPVAISLSLSELCAKFKLHAFLSGSKESSMFFGENHPTKFEYHEALANESDDQMDVLNLALAYF